jgi:hypothetical protein
MKARKMWAIPYVRVSRGKYEPMALSRSGAWAIFSTEEMAKDRAPCEQEPIPVLVTIVPVPRKGGTK